MFSKMLLIVDSPLLQLISIDFAIQLVGFIISARLQTEKFYDITGSSTFIFLTYLCNKWNPNRSLKQKIQSGMVLMWAVRLGSYLFIRVLKTGQDRRFNEARKKPSLLFIFWILQGIWVFVTLLPSLMLFLDKTDHPFTNRDYIGFGMWIFGFLFEVTADYQKSVFRNNPQNKGKFISTGLWSISQHPNYFGEIMLWFGLYFSASSTFKGKELLTVLCPIFDMFLITKVSGIPPLEMYGIKKWGRDPLYQKYTKNTARLIPYLW